MTNLSALPTLTLAQVTEQCTLLQGQLDTVASELSTLTPGTPGHLSLAQRCHSLAGQLARLQAEQATLSEQARGEAQLQAERAERAEQAKEQAEQARLQAEQELSALVVAINEASDSLAQALALAAAKVPALAQHLPGQLSGWPEIVPTISGNGVISRLPYVSGRTLTSRYHVGKVTG
jgi:multidrug efflux pump subunit AcrA (membrane-fusion protein)